MSGWTSVKEGLPDEGKRVLARVKCICFYESTGFVDDFVVREASCVVQDGYKRKRIWYLWDSPDVGVGCNIGEVTHWMPLPEPPKEDDHDNV